MKTVTLYTDGACSGNPGPGGWGAILEYMGHEKEFSGGEASTTNNRMELTAVIEGLEKLKEPCIVETNTSIFPAAKSRITASFSAFFICPCTKETRSSGSLAASSSAYCTAAFMGGASSCPIGFSTPPKSASSGMSAASSSSVFSSTAGQTT